jgi:hypothetical protein
MSPLPNLMPKNDGSAEHAIKAAHKMARVNAFISNRIKRLLNTGRLNTYSIVLTTFKRRNVETGILTFKNEMSNLNLSLFIPGIPNQILF